MAREGTPAIDHLVARYPGKAKFILNYVDLLEKGSPQVAEVTLFHTDVEALWEAFKSHYKLVPAAGGVVRNFAQQWLLIFRRGHWDLPKGKIDAGETPEQAAIREVQEETGLHQLTLGSALPSSFHTYRDDKDRRVLKETHWYLMDTPETQLIPQAEEDIEKAVWMSPSHFFQEKRVVYPNIEQLLKEALKTA
jgi:8-oxo-dGTP pyrophosphatase MutT (NUDIX family)